MEIEIKTTKFLLAEGISTGRKTEVGETVPRISAGASASGSKAGAKRHLTDEDILVKRKKFESNISNVSGDKKNELPSFWIPQLNPTAEVKMEKPSRKVSCPVTGKPLKIKELMSVKFTPVKEDEEDLGKSMISRHIRYKCPVTHDLLTNTMRLAYLKTSQSIVTMGCVERIIRKDMIDPLSGKQMNEDDIIELQRGGTGFSTTNVVEAKIIRPQLELQ